MNVDVSLREADNRERLVHAHTCTSAHAGTRVYTLRAPMLNYAACIFSGLFGGSQSLTGNPAVCAHAYAHTQANTPGDSSAEATQNARKFFNFTAGCACKNARRERRISLERGRFQTENRIMMGPQRDSWNFFATGDLVLSGHY